MAATSVQIYQRTYANILDKLKSGISLDSDELSTLQDQFCDIRVDQSENIWESIEKIIPCLYDLIDLLFASLKTLRQENSSAREKQEKILVELQGKTQKCEEKLKEMKGNRIQLVFGQIATEIESKIAHRVLDDIVGQDHYVENIDDLEAALYNPNSCYADIFTDKEDKLIEAKDKFKKLKEDFKFTKELQIYLFHLKKYRNTVAHPDVDSEEVERALDKNVIPQLNKKKFKELWEIYKKIPKKWLI